jgi:8-oxo-dGTP pyrophosphatase MutT (NUDIX family)
MARQEGNVPDPDDPVDDEIAHRSYLVAAVREAFEEAGLLLVRQRDESWLDLAHGPTREKFEAYRIALNGGALDFGDLLREESLHINGRDLTYWSRWITPLGPPRRFDARFFVAELPSGHEASPDHGELVHSEWVRPADALMRHGDGGFPMIFPTIKTLRSLL